MKIQERKIKWLAAILACALFSAACRDDKAQNVNAGLDEPQVVSQETEDTFVPSITQDTDEQSPQQPSEMQNYQIGDVDVPFESYEALIEAYAKDEDVFTFIEDESFKAYSAFDIDADGSPELFLAVIHPYEYNDIKDMYLTDERLYTVDAKKQPVALLPKSNSTVYAGELAVFAAPAGNVIRMVTKEGENSSERTYYLLQDSALKTAYACFVQNGPAVARAGELTKETWQAKYQDIPFKSDLYYLKFAGEESWSAAMGKEQMAEKTAEYAGKQVMLTWQAIKLSESQ